MSFYSRRLLLFFLALGLLTACKRKHHAVSRGFYYWKTVYKPTSFEVNKLHQLGVQKMYLRLFDVDEDKATRHAVPVATIHMGAKDTGLAYVPVVFITQRALLTLTDSTAVNQLAQNIISLAELLCTQAGIAPAELQIDCDWTSGSKNTYFALLRAIKALPYMRGKTLSCTIRLNQVKYVVRNGIPPVDRGLVMCYGMGNLKKAGPLNSILNADEAKDYLKHMDTYPLPLDMALPLFDWCLLFRGDQFRGILRSVAIDDVQHSGLFKRKEDNLYTCLHDTAWLGYNLNVNDIIRVEKPRYEDILSIAGFSSQQIKNMDMNVIFFDCDSITLNKFSNNDLETIYNSYR